MLPFSVTTYTHARTHKYKHEQPFFCCQNRKFGNVGARLIRAGSHETARADSPFLLARPHLSVSGEIERRAEDISQGFDPRLTKVGHRRLCHREDFSERFNGTAQNDLVTPVRATRAPRIQMRSASTQRASQFRDFLLVAMLPLGRCHREAYGRRQLSRKKSLSLDIIDCYVTRCFITYITRVSRVVDTYLSIPF